MKILFLDTGFDKTSETFRKQRSSVKDCNNVCLYKKAEKSLLDKIIMALGIYLFPPLLLFAYGSWKKELDNYDLFIIPSRRPAKYAAKYIKKKTGKRVIVWYWNLVTDKEIPPDYCKKIGCEPWTFDRKDSEKYNMSFGDTYYFPGFVDNTTPFSVKNDVFYVGINRPGREEFLNDLETYLKKHDMTCRINLAAIPTDSKKVREKYTGRMTYEEIINAIRETRAILDLNREDQTGLTLRPLEALFFKRKLVTNNAHIKSYKVYNPENVFVVSDNDFTGLEDFLKRPYVPAGNEEEIVRRYTFSDWLGRIVNEEEAD